MVCEDVGRGTLGNDKKKGRKNENLQDYQRGKKRKREEVVMVVAAVG